MSSEAIARLWAETRERVEGMQGKWFHYTGVIVTVIGPCLLEGSGEPAVRYIDDDDPHQVEWVRTLDVWFEKVKVGDAMVARYTRLGEGG